MDQPTQIRTSPLALADAYKESHHCQYPEGICWVYSNFTPRYGKHNGHGGSRVVFFGLQAFLYQLNEHFDRNFFNLSRIDAVNEFKAFYSGFFGSDDEAIYKRIEALHDLGFLPLHFKALPEGSLVPYGVPMLTVCNTHPAFFWLTNFVETWLSCALWHPCTSATTAYYYREGFERFAEETGANKGFVPFQGHDFSMRGLPGLGAACASGAAHLTSFVGTDSCPSIDWIKRYYGPVDGLIGTSVPATEHSVMCAGGEESELETFRRLITECYPSGIVSIVSDTWDFWDVVTRILPTLKDEIMARDGKVVIRPDSGDPFIILCGNPISSHGAENKGLIACLWEIFGGATNAKGFKELDPHIGAIYGDSITIELQRRILEELKSQGFASSNIILGIGSYTYQMVTRDTHGFAMKATAVGFGDSLETMEIKPIFKTPKTDSGGKNSARGLLLVNVSHGGPVEGNYYLEQGVSPDREANENRLTDVYVDGALVNPTTFSEIRARLWA